MRFRNSLIVSAAAAAAIAAPAHAAPQILALLETPSPVALHCEGAVCTATLSSYCLQVERYAPASGMKLHLAKGGKVTLVIRDRSGAERRVDASAIARFASARKEYAVRISVPRAALGASAQTVSVQIGTQVSLIPEKIAGDPRPHKPDEIRRVTTQSRLAGQIMEQGRYKTLVQAAQVMNGITNRLDRGHSIGRIMLDWMRGAERLPVAVTSIVGHHVSQCQLSVNPGECLKARHDNLLFQYNLKYWRRNKDAGL